MIVLPNLHGFFSSYPEIQVDIGISDRTVDLIEEGVDFVVRGGFSSQEKPGARLLGNATWTTCATPEYLRKAGTPAHPLEIERGHHIVGFRSALTGRPISTRFERGNDRFEFDGPYLVSVNDGSARAAAGLAGLGILPTFTFAVASHIAAGRLIPILQEWQPEPYPFFIIAPANRQMPNRVAVFVEWLTEIFSKLG